MRATADSSLIVALYLAETDSARADAAFAAAPPLILLTDWHRVEIANAFQRAVKTGRITTVQAALLWHAQIPRSLLPPRPRSELILGRFHKKARCVL